MSAFMVAIDIRTQVKIPVSHAIYIAR